MHGAIFVAMQKKERPSLRARAVTLLLSETIVDETKVLARGLTRQVKAVRLVDDFLAVHVRRAMFEFPSLSPIIHRLTNALEKLRDGVLCMTARQLTVRGAHHLFDDSEVVILDRVFDIERRDDTRSRRNILGGSNPRQKTGRGVDHVFHVSIHERTNTTGDEDDGSASGYIHR